MQSTSKQNTTAAQGSMPTTISLAGNTLYLTCMEDQETNILCTVQNRIACFRLSLDFLQTMQLSFRVILIPQDQSLMTPPPLTWRSRAVHWTNAFNLTPIKILIWNCRGAGCPTFCRDFANLLRSHHPEIAIIMETCISGFRAEEVSSSFGFDKVSRSDAVGFCGGIWILLKRAQHSLGHLLCH